MGTQDALPCPLPCFSGEWRVVGWQSTHKGHLTRESRLDWLLSSLPSFLTGTSCYPKLRSAWVSLNLYPCPGPCSHMLSHSAELTDLHLTSPWQRVRLMLRMMQLLKGRATPQELAGSGGWALPPRGSLQPPFTFSSVLFANHPPFSLLILFSVIPALPSFHKLLESIVSSCCLYIFSIHPSLQSLEFAFCPIYFLKQLLKVTNKSSRSSDDIFFNLHLSHSV